jgi:putative nucleotidyltransferase with HDIG domain
MYGEKLYIVLYIQGEKMKHALQHQLHFSSETGSVIDLKDLDFPVEPKILVVDDEYTIIQIIISILNANGYTGDRVRTVKDACAAVKKKRYDIVFLDLGLPDGSGFAVLEKIVDGSPDTLIVVITGVHDIHTAVHAIRKGAFDYITKPFSIMLFQERLNTVREEWKSRTFTRTYQQYLEKLLKERTEELLHTFSRIEHIHDETVCALGAALDLRDPETQEHCRRVSENSMLLGECLGVGREEIRDLRWGAYLHDIGKIGIPEHILLKKGPLSNDEMDIVKKHSILGYSMIKNIDFLSKASEVVLYHHEKYDGSGYPYGLKGKSIPLFARIFAVADAFDAMVAKRPYRNAMSIEEGIQEVKRCEGGHFDPDIVAAFLQLPLSKLRIEDPH